jgi:hypothetical protein
VTAEQYLRQRLGSGLADDQLQGWVVRLWCEALKDAACYDPAYQGSEDLLDLSRIRWRRYADRVLAGGHATPLPLTG